MGPVIKYIQQFQKLILKMNGILDDKLLDLFKPSLEKVFMLARKVESKNLEMDTRRNTYCTSRENNVPSITHLNLQG